MSEPMNDREFVEKFRRGTHKINEQDWNRLCQLAGSQSDSPYMMLDLALMRLDLADRDKQLEWALEMIKKAPREATCKSEENMNIAYGPKDPSTEVMTEETDLQIASRVRMLSRCDIYHEIVCMAGRDRIMRLHYQLAERDKQVAELSVSGGELIERWHTAIDQRDEARRQVAELDRSVFVSQADAADLEEKLDAMTRERDKAQDEAWANWESFKRAESERDAYSKAAGDYAVEIGRLEEKLAERDKQVAELSVSGGELIERWHTAIDQRDEARRQVAELTTKNAALELENAALDEGGARPKLLFSRK